MPNRQDFLTAPRADMDPLRSRHGLAPVEYGCAFEHYRPDPMSVFDKRVAEIIGAILLGLVLGILLSLFV